MAERMLTVEVVHAAPGGVILCRASVPAGTTVMEAVDASGIATRLPVGTIDPQRLGIFSRKVPPVRAVQDGDRIEIYRPLLLDPMEARRRRAR